MKSIKCNITGQFHEIRKEILRGCDWKLIDEIETYLSTYYNDSLMSIIRHRSIIREDSRDKSIHTERTT